ncbi:MAG: hypothetical protein ACRDAM_16050 [Casimicrobium sp.]
MKTFFLWCVGGSFPRDVISETKPEFACSPVLKDGHPTEKEAIKTLPMSAWHESVEAGSWKEAKALFRQRGLLLR